MNPSVTSPLFEHALDAPSAFRPEELVEAVRCSRNLEASPVPPICVLDFDGDLTDWLAQHDKAAVFEPWACFHTRMLELQVDGLRWGVIPRTIGGPYAVLVAEQLRVSGVRLILGLTSAGRVSSSLALPGWVVVSSAVRDEGTSLHYLPAAEQVACPTPICELLARELSTSGLPVTQGSVWTTDAPYRETEVQLQRHAANGVLAVEMQAASLFAFATAQQLPIGIVAHVTNGSDHSDQFNKGKDEDAFALMLSMVRAGYQYLDTL